MLEKTQIISDRYQLIEKLGRNAGRQTWLATDLNSAKKEQVIVKLLAFGGDVQWEDLKLFEREAQILKQLNHPRIPKYKDYFSIDDRTLWFGLVQQYIPGLSLKQLLDRGKRFTEVDIENIAQEILAILLYLHRLNPPLLHRDIKPSNLIWGEDGQIYLVDFGAVQDRAATEGATFTVVGTYGYAPIEQFGGRAVPASDLYALGATLIHLLTHTPPADLPNRELTIQFRERLYLNSGLANWLEKMTIPALEKRYSSAQQALDALKSKDKLDGFNFDLHKLNLQGQNINNIINRPINTKIKIFRNRKFLEIVIPRQGINSLNHLFNLGSIVLGMGILAITLFLSPILFLISMSPWFMIWFIIFLLIVFASKINNGNIKQIFSSTTIKINDDNFFIATNLLGIKNLQTGATENIKDVSVNYSNNQSPQKRMTTEAIIINTKLRYQNQFKRYLFGQGLTEEELIWIANEIRSWLASTN